jgi:four helix bundle protein
LARILENLIGRVEGVCDRVLNVASALEKTKVSRRIIDQLVGSGTSIGANVFEADETMCRADFVKCLCIAVKELNETRFWPRPAARHEWIPAARTQPLLVELVEIKKIFGTMISRTKSQAT